MSEPGYQMVHNFAQIYQAQWAEAGLQVRVKPDKTTTDCYIIKSPLGGPMIGRITPKGIEIDGAVRFPHDDPKSLDTSLAFLKKAVAKHEAMMDMQAEKREQEG